MATLTGDNGLLTKAGEAKKTNEESTALEKIQVEVLGSYNKNGKVDIDQLKTNLKHLNISDEDIIPTIKNEGETFPITVKLNNGTYDIYNDGDVIGPINYKKLELLYGKEINGYTGYEATDVTKWKLLYTNEESNEIFIVSSNVVNNGKLQLVSSKGVEYTGSNSVMSFEYGRKYNRLWLEKCTEESTQTNAKAVAYLCDPDNWSQYMTGKAKYAAGSPTLEIIAAACNGVQSNKITIKNVNSIGYPEYLSAIKTDSFRTELFNLGGTYWIASPSKYSSGTFVDFAQNDSMFHYSCDR